MFCARANEESRFLELRWVRVEQGGEGLDGLEQLHSRARAPAGSSGSEKELRREGEIATPAERSQSVHRLSKESCSKDGQRLRDGNHPPSSYSSPFPPGSFGGLANRRAQARPSTEPPDSRQEWVGLSPLLNATSHTRVRARLDMLSPWRLPSTGHRLPCVARDWNTSPSHGTPSKV